MRWLDSAFESGVKPPHSIPARNSLANYVTSTAINRLLNQLGELKNRFGSREHRSVERILSELGRQEVADGETLVRLHETLLFISAYPQSARARTLAESLLRNFAKRVEKLRAAGEDLSPLESPEVSGIAGMSVTDTFSYYIVRWLVRLPQDRVALAWEWFEDENRLAETWPRFMPLLEEDSFVEANVPYQTWLRAASGGAAKDLTWLIRRFASLPKTDMEKAELYDSQKLYVRWSPPYRATRTGMRLATSKVFYHRDPLIQRREVSLQREMENPAPPLERLSAKQGEAILDMAREASTVRYRELYGFTHGDPRRVFKTNLGRGINVFITALPPKRRLPLRAYHAAMIFKNGVPVGYFEGLSLFERMESGFNLYYSFREGETAWLYARILSIFRHLLGVTAFSIDPYQVGYENQEGIESGAFWFYRKLGFRPTSPAVTKLMRSEEKKIASRSTYRTAAKTLRQLAAGSMIFEVDKSKSGDWDRFQVRNVGLAVQRQMAAKHIGNADRFRAEAVKELTRALGIRTNDWREAELRPFSDFAVTLSLVKDLSEWRDIEKRALVRVIHAKTTSDESSYLKLMQKHARLRKAIIKMGSLSGPIEYL
ncbi:MAG TPA: hypothetical protein DCK93_02535 [Blastocatellia bacterium]|nr:hypothetical protein [Blastocatellia bacterium]HAF21782.1 hypothetical protein [Blastocatellia bacterium]